MACKTGPLQNCRRLLGKRNRTADYVISKNSRVTKWQM